MKKILVIGSSGAGKSTFAQRLGQKTNLPVVHLDQLYWQPNWVEPDKEDWKKTVEKALKADAWIMDGNYSGTMDLRLAACDTVVFLDFPRTVCTWRVVRRVAGSYKKRRADMAEGCLEQFDWEFLKFVWNFPSRSKPKVEALLKRYEPEKTVIRLASRGEVEDFFANRFSDSDAVKSF